MTEPILLDEQLCFAVYRAQKDFNHFYAKTLSPYGLTYPQYIVLLALWEHGSLTVNHLGKFLELDSGTLTPLLKRLEKNDWVSRKRDEKDERRVLISLTQKGISNRDEIFKYVGGCLKDLKFNNDDYMRSMDTVNDISSRLEKIDEQSK